MTYTIQKSLFKFLNKLKENTKIGIHEYFKFSNNDIHLTPFIYDIGFQLLVEYYLVIIDCFFIMIFSTCSSMHLPSYLVIFFSNK